MTNDDPTSFNQPDLRSLTADDLDSLGRALISVTMELSILSNRVLVLEDVLASKGIDIEGLVDTHQPSEHAQAKIDENTKRLAENVLQALID